MESKSSEKGFQISNAKIPILLSLKKVSDLKPHEETVEKDLEGITRRLESDPILRHPIIADYRSGAVLDGTHRLAALSKLGCHTIPTALIDYQNPLVLIDRWFRRVSGEELGDFVKRVDELSPMALSAPEAEKNLLARINYATARDHRQCFGFKSKEQSPLELCRSAFRLEEIAEAENAKISYTDNDRIDDLSESGFLMSTIRLEKSEVIASCLKHELFPPKSTRHMIPSRPLGINFPLRWLEDDDLQEAETQFEKHLRSKRLKRLPEGSRVGSRRYMEEVFLFE